MPSLQIACRLDQQVAGQKKIGKADRNRNGGGMKKHTLNWLVLAVFSLSLAGVATSSVDAAQITAVANESPGTVIVRTGQRRL